jgi:hypothetical protein
MRRIDIAGNCALNRVRLSAVTAAPEATCHLHFTNLYFRKRTSHDMPSAIRGELDKSILVRSGCALPADYFCHARVDFTYHPSVAGTGFAFVVAMV